MNIKFFVAIIFFAIHSLTYSMQSKSDGHLELLSKAALYSLYSLPSNIYNPGNITATEENCKNLLNALYGARENKFAGYDMEKISVMKNLWKTTYINLDGQLEDMIKLHKTMLKTCGKQKIKVPIDNIITRDHDRIDAQTTSLFSSLESLRNIKCNVSAIHLNLLATQFQDLQAKK